MEHVALTTTLDPGVDLFPIAAPADPDSAFVLVVRDDDTRGGFLSTICDFLGLPVEHVGGDEDLAPLLRINPPIAVVAELDGPHQDGCHVMKTVASIDRTLPILLLTDGNPADLGAVDAVRELFGLTRIATATGLGDIGKLVDFLCQASREAGQLRLLLA